MIDVREFQGMDIAAACSAAEAMTPAEACRVAAGIIGGLFDPYSRLALLYDQAPGFEAAAPSGVHRVFPMSLDELAHEASGLAEEFRNAAMALDDASARPDMPPVLTAMGFREELGGGGEVFASLYLDNGWQINATGGQACGMPSEDDFCVCVYPQGWDGEPVPFDVRRVRTDPPHYHNDALTLGRTIAAALAFAGRAVDFADIEAATPQPDGITVRGTFGIACPRCNRDDALSVEATVPVRFVKDKTDGGVSDWAETTDVHYGSESTMTCGHCDYQDEMKAFNAPAA